MVTLTLEAADEASAGQLARGLGQVRGRYPRSRGLSQHRPGRLGYPSGPVSTGPEVGFSRRPAGPLRLGRHGARWPSPAAACWPTARRRPLGRHVRPRPGLIVVCYRSDNLAAWTPPRSYASAGGAPVSRCGSWAERADTSPATLSAYEHGQVVPHVDTLTRIVRRGGFYSGRQLMRRHTAGPEEAAQRPRVATRP